MLCYSCGSNNPIDHKFCISCGRPYVESNFPKLADIDKKDNYVFVRQSRFSANSTIHDYKTNEQRFKISYLELLQKIFIKMFLVSVIWLIILFAIIPFILDNFNEFIANLFVILSSFTLLSLWSFAISKSFNQKVIIEDLRNNKSFEFKIRGRPNSNSPLIRFTEYAKDIKFSLSTGYVGKLTFDDKSYSFKITPTELIRFQVFNESNDIQMELISSFGPEKDKIDFYPTYFQILLNSDINEITLIFLAIYIIKKVFSEREE